jgi:ABC-type glutathione transport system ATPase component
LRRGKSLYAAGDAEISNGAGFSAIRRRGESVFLPGEPFRWLTESTVAEELGRFHLGNDFDRRLKILGARGITAEADPEHLSYGERKLVCTLSLPEHLELVCLDEPFADLGGPLLETMEQFICDQVDSMHWSSVLISHSSDVSLEN